MGKGIKTTIIIIGGVLAFLLSAVVIIYVFFPGLPIYVLVRKECPQVNKPITDYPYKNVAVPDDFITISHHGITLRAPSSLYMKPAEIMAKLYIDSQDNQERKNMLWFTEMRDCSDFSLEDREISEEQLEAFCASINYPVPKTEYDMFRIIHSLTMEDFNVRSRDGAAAFATFAVLKEMLSSPFLYSYYFETDTGIGFIHVLNEPSEDEPLYSWSVSLYAGENLGTESHVIISTENLEIMKQIVASIEADG